MLWGGKRWIFRVLLSKCDILCDHVAFPKLTFGAFVQNLELIPIQSPKVERGTSVLLHKYSDIYCVQTKVCCSKLPVSTWHMQNVQNVFLGGCHSNENLKHLTDRYRLMFKNEFAQNIHLFWSSHRGEYAKIVAFYKQTSELILVYKPAEFTHAELFSAIAILYTLFSCLCQKLLWPLVAALRGNLSGLWEASDSQSSVPYSQLPELHKLDTVWRCYNMGGMWIVLLY